jgi:arginyl-tRNA synthetase
MTKLNGDTGLYIQYTAVRLRSLLEKLKWSRNDQNSSHDIDLSTADEYDPPLHLGWQLDPELRSLLFQTSLLPQKITHALDLFKPHILTQYLFDLTGRFNKRYNDSEKVLDMEDNQKESVYSILLVYQVVLEKVMELLHLPKVEKM